jgi:haloacetate dehalogenase
MFEGFKRGIVSVDGIDISYVTGGSGPPVLMLHGFPQSLSMWAQVAPQLARRFTIVCADLRGYGESSKHPYRAAIFLSISFPMTPRGRFRNS